MAKVMIIDLGTGKSKKMTSAAVVSTPQADNNEENNEQDGNE